MEMDEYEYEERIKELEDWEGRIVRHFKGDLYIILSTNVINTETNERMVCYKALYDDCKIYVRPVKMFVEKCSEEQFRKYWQEYRFAMISRASERH